MKGYCQTKGHADVPHKRRASCFEWMGTHQLEARKESHAIEPKAGEIPQNEVPQKQEVRTQLA
jgi:hypothetical protein